MNRQEKAVEKFNNGYNCAQSVVMAFCEDLGLSEEECAIMSEGFGGGMGRTRSVCGAVSGMVMLAGLKMSKGIAKDMETRTKIYAAVQAMMADFKAEMGTTICSELLGEQLPKDKGATPTERTDSFYKKRPCSEIVRLCTEIAQKHLFD